jgi:hypothetical protein
MELKNQHIIIVSNEPWGDIWFSKHNYAHELSKKNTVFFINSPSKWKFSFLFNNKLNSEKINNNFHVISINNHFPSKYIFLKEINNWIASKKLKKHLKNQGYKTWVLWSFTPLFLFRPNLLNPIYSIFHVVDLHWSQFYGWSILAKKSNLLIFVSELIKTEYENIETKKMVISHGISEEEYILNDKKLNQVKLELSEYGNFGLFVGCIDQRLDFEAIEMMIKQFNKTKFVFIGPLNIKSNHPFYYLFNGLSDNVICLGPKPFKELKYYIHLSHFCISPMNLNHPGNNISHHKTMQYLLQGKAVFSPIFLEYENINDLLYQENYTPTLFKRLEKFIDSGENIILKEKRIEYTKKLRFPNLLQTIENEIND